MRQLTSGATKIAGAFGETGLLTQPESQRRFRSESGMAGGLLLRVQNQATRVRAGATVGAVLTGLLISPLWTAAAATPAAAKPACLPEQASDVAARAMAVSCGQRVEVSGARNER